MDGDDDMFPSISYTMCRLIPITLFVDATVNNSHYHRLQLSLLPAHARAGHSVQGMTARDGLF